MKICLAHECANYIYCIHIKTVSNVRKVTLGSIVRIPERNF